MLDLLKMKALIRKNEMVIRWKIVQGNYTKENFVVELDNGNYAVHQIEFDKNKYSLDDVKDISYELAEMLGVEFNEMSFNR